MSISDILDETVDLYRNNFVLLIGIAAVAYIPITLLQKFVERWFAAPRGPEPNIEGSIQAMVAQMLVLPVLLLVSSIVTGALTLGISERYLGRETSVGSCYRRVLSPRLLIKLIGAILLKSLVIVTPLLIAGAGIGAYAASVAVSASMPSWVVISVVAVVVLLAALVPVIYLAVRLALVEPCFMLESRRVGRSVSRSWSLMRANVAKGFVLLAIVVIVVIILTYMITGPTTAITIWQERLGKPVSPVVLVIDAILFTIMACITAPITSIAQILLYYDMRIRKEGFDLELLASELDAKARRFSAEGAAGLAEEKTQPIEPQAEHLRTEPAPEGGEAS